MMNTRSAYEKIFTRSEIDFKAIVEDGWCGCFMGGKDSQGIYGVTHNRTDLDRWLVLDKSVAEAWTKSPADVLECH